MSLNDQRLCDRALRQSGNSTKRYRPRLSGNVKATLMMNSVRK
jgi:hypothetical protein